MLYRRGKKILVSPFLSTQPGICPFAPYPDVSALYFHNGVAGKTIGSSLANSGKCLSLSRVPGRSAQRLAGCLPAWDHPWPTTREWSQLCFEAFLIAKMHVPEGKQTMRCLLMLGMVPIRGSHFHCILLAKDQVTSPGQPPGGDTAPLLW